MRARPIAAVVLLPWCLPGADPTAASVADAAKRDDRAAVRTLLAAHADPNSAQADGSTALHWAAYHDDIEMAQALLHAGANAKAATRYTVTPLTLACTNGSGPMVRLLLKAGADPNTAVDGGETVLMTSARTGKVDALKALIEGGANVNAKESRRGQTALMWAAAEGNAEAVRLLIDAGADFRTRIDSGFDAFLFAARDGRGAVIRTLLKAGANANDTIQRASTGRRGSQGRGVPAAGTSALLLAVTNGHFDLAAQLLEAGANPNANATGLTALHMISNVRKPGVGDNDPPPTGSGNMTSLEFVKHIVARGADINARMTRRINLGLTGLNTLGATPYFLAAKTADTELMRLLASLGADTKIGNADNATPLMAAAGLGTRSPGEDAGTESEVLEALQVALDHGADINAVDNNGETAMHGAAYKNSPGAVEFLARKGAKIGVWHKKNKYGWTPLTIAEGYRFGNYKPSPVTVEALHKVMLAAGVTPPPPNWKSAEAK